MRGVDADTGADVGSGAGAEMDALTAWALWTAIALVMVMSRVGCLAYS